MHPYYGHEGESETNASNFILKFENLIAENKISPLDRETFQLQSNYHHWLYVLAAMNKCMHGHDHKGGGHS